MVSMRGRVTDKTSDGAWVRFESPTHFCEGCHCGVLFASTGHSTGKNIWLPGHRLPGHEASGEDIVLTVSKGDNLQLITHSIGLPLAGFVVGALVSHQLGASELLVVLGSMLGMTIGIFYCKELSFHKFQINRG